MEFYDHFGDSSSEYHYDELGYAADSGGRSDGILVLLGGLRGLWSYPEGFLKAPLGYLGCLGAVLGCLGAVWRPK